MLLRQQCLGLLLHGVTGMLCGALLIAGITAVAMLAASEIVWGQHVGHPRMAAYFKQRVQQHPSPVTQFAYASACHLGGALGVAEHYYGTVLDQPLYAPRALNNLGAIAWAKGWHGLAQDYFTQAYRRDARLAAAAYNLWLATHEDHWLHAAFQHEPKRVQMYRLYRPGQPMIVSVQIAEYHEILLGVPHWYDRATSVFRAYLSGKSFEVLAFKRLTETFKGLKSTKAPSQRRIPSGYFLVIMVIVAFLLISWGVSLEPTGRATPGPFTLPMPTPDLPKPSLGHVVIPGSFQAVAGHHLTGSVLFGLTVFAAAEQWCFWNWGAPGMWTKISTQTKLMGIDLGESLPMILRQHDPVWRLLDQGSLWLLVGCYTVNLLWMRLATRRTAH
jgi:hypothetical protein